MRSLFSREAATPEASVVPAAPTAGWNNLSGNAKIGIAAVFAAGAVAVVILPDLIRQPKPEAPPQTETHLQPRISDYQPAIPAQPIVAQVRAPEITPTTSGRRRAGPPTEMALYAPPNALPTKANAADGTRPADPDNAASEGGRGAAMRGGIADPNDRLATSLGGATVLPSSRAIIVRNRSFIIRAGASIPCQGVEAVNSARPGFVSCRLSQPYRGDDGRRMLLPPGTTIFGQIRSGLQQNEMRLGVLFTLIETPWFDQPLQAPGSDALGRAGLDGDLKTFFWDRAAAVGLYALMDVGVGAGQNLASSAMSRAFSNGGGPTLNLGGQAQGLASQQFGATINRPPELTRPEGMPLSVSVGQTLDFTDACRQAMQIDPMACPLL